MTNHQSKKQGYIDPESAEAVVQNQFDIYKHIQNKAFRTIQSLIAGVALLGVFNPEWIIAAINIQSNLEEAAQSWLGEPITVAASFLVSFLLIFIFLILATMSLISGVNDMVSVLRYDPPQPANISIEPSAVKQSSFLPYVDYNQKILEDMKNDFDEGFDKIRNTLLIFGFFFSVAFIASGASLEMMLLVSILSFLVTLWIVLYSIAWFPYQLYSDRDFQHHFIDPLPAGLQEFAGIFYTMSIITLLFSSIATYSIVLDLYSSLV